MILSSLGVISGRGASSLNNGLFAAYNADNNANDSLGTYNGTPIGGLTYTTGKIGNAFNFNGTNAYVSLPNNSMNLTGDFTISIWVYYTATGAQTLFANGFYDVGTNIYKGWAIIHLCKG